MWHFEIEIYVPFGQLFILQNVNIFVFFATKQHLTFKAFERNETFSHREQIENVSFSPNNRGF